MFFLRGVELGSHALWYSLCCIFRNSYNSNSMNLLKAVGQSRRPVRANKCVTPRCCSFRPSEVRCAQGWGKGRKRLISSSLHSLASLKLQLCNFLFFKLSSFQWLNLFFFFFPLPMLQKSHSSFPDFLFLKKLRERGDFTRQVWRGYFKCVGYLHHHFRAQGKKLFQVQPPLNFGMVAVLLVLDTKGR